MLKGFKDFILRGNVIELAVAVIIGSAFTAIVTAVTNSLIQPLINSFGSAEVQGLGFRIIRDNPSTLIDFGAVITAAINFLIVAAVVYFLIVMPINKINDAAKRRQGIDPTVSAPTTEELLAQIRDLIEAQSKVSAPQVNESAVPTATADVKDTGSSQPTDGGRHQA
ncbi:large conductance mechanosensitive channel protein MscL [Corynebacterium flavescens]|uniref:Large-conductance mechanosensitive channel n=1 Tax=Corynebacterium flavescens TaxID=28028 RepID=A0A1L7CKR1_CORFL|nr:MULTISPECIES: large conductance mechanosensitive channel protein MscL [Corynebacterium]APT86461.1 mechanosensitive ion channel protein MscL [Corynebacterium flavescens]KAA8723669.1 large conductance mechanosensitive channel protein MscL [Corynebacterium flavescens]MDN6551182.1 large conductance mechanosensitive channel protein MscL [Corynebacterium flavescens]GEB97640.1 large conductance mechanosensitive channel protein MscL [Corynebacterium flavescens]HCG47367.1 large conductance mechanose